MTGWASKSLADVVALQRGYDLPTVSRKVGAVPIIGSFGITGFHEVAKFRGPGVAIGRSGASIGKATYVSGDYWPLNTCLFVTDFRGNEPRWVFHLLDQIDFTQFNSGSAQPSLNRNHLRGIPVSVPPVSDQHAIADVLGALGDKAASNIVLASTAEALAAAYVASSLSSCSVSELAALDLRAVTPNSLGTRLVPHYSIPAFDRDQRPTMDATADIKSNKFLIDDARVLVSKLNPRLPRVWAVDNVTGLPGLASTEMLPLAATEVSYRVLKAVLSRPEFGHQLESQVAGTSGSHQRVSPHDVMNTDVPDPRELPPNRLAAIDTLVALATQARRENVTLADLRDTLLPALMSGRLRVKDAERQVEDAV